MNKQQQSPPRFPHRFFRWYCHETLLDHIEGDLLEDYQLTAEKSGKARADIKFTLDVIQLFRPGIIRPIEGTKSLNTIGMYKSYFKIGWRTLLRNKSYSLINIGGLALGISCAIIIFSIVNYHLGFDNFHAHSDRIYRFVTEEHRDMVEYSPAVPPAFAPAFRRDYTFGEKVARELLITGQLLTIEEGGKVVKYQEDVAFAEPEFLGIFNFPLSAGNRDQALSDPHTVIISERIARKYFGDEPAIGRLIRFGNEIDFTVTGVLKDIPENTDLKTEIYFSYATMKQVNEWFASDNAWGGISTELRTYALIHPGVTPAMVEEKLPAYVKKFRPNSKNVHHYKLQPLGDMHFNPHYGGTMSKTTIGVLTVVGLLLIFTACLNFINLATSQAVVRAREVGVRKVLGSIRRQLFWQFNMETLIIVMLATLLAFAGAYAFTPYLNQLLNIHLSLNLFSDARLLVFLALLILVVTLLSGSYPAMVLSRFLPVQALKGKLQGMPGGNFNIRRGLIVSQFIITQVLLIGLIVMAYQMKYIHGKEMGFDHQAIVMIPTGSNDSKLNTLKTQFEAIPHVEKVSLVYAPPAAQHMYWSTSFRYDNRTEPEAFAMTFKGGDESFLPTFNIELVAGRNLVPSDTVREFLVNEKTVVKLGLSSPEDILGKPITVGNKWTAPVVGVVRDFHSHSLHEDIEPVCITTSRDDYHAIAVKINMAEAPATLSALEKAWSGMYPELIYQYDFLDDQIAAFYVGEQTMMTLIQIFSGIALIIGGLGLYGLVSFMAVQKTKEIGIRKVMGGSVAQILWIFGKEFSRLVLIAFLIAAPVAWVIMSQWLSNYAYRTEIGLGVFAIELAIVLAVVFLTAGYRSFAAARANPVNSLRSE